MSRYKIKRFFEKEEEFQRQHRKRKADNQRQHNEIIKILINSNPTISHVRDSDCVLKFTVSIKIYNACNENYRVLVLAVNFGT